MINNWVSPVSKGKFNGFKTANSNLLFNKVEFYNSNQPQLENIKIGIIGIDKMDADKTRFCLYQLSSLSVNGIMDFGNIRNSEPSFVIPFIKELLNAKILPILIGGDKTDCKILVEALSVLERPINVALVDESYRSMDGQEDQWVNVFKKASQRIKQLSLLGYQGHFPINHLVFASGINHQEVRLGQVRSDLVSTEPFFRDADMACISLNACRYSEAMAGTSKTPNGFFGEELCQLSRYAGISDRISAASFSGFDLDNDPHEITAKLAAQSIWYFLEGYGARKGDYPLDPNNLTEFMVDVQKLKTRISFWKSKRSGRWWMQVPSIGNNSSNLISCSYNDYLEANKDEIPERLLKAMEQD